MSVVSYLFIAFLAITVFVYYIVPKKMQWVVLLAASLIFLWLQRNRKSAYCDRNRAAGLSIITPDAEKSGQTGAAFGWSRETGSQKDKKINKKKEKKEIF